MNATDMTVDPSGVRDRLPTIPATAVDELGQRQPTLERPGRPTHDAPVRNRKREPDRDRRRRRSSTY